MHKYEKTRQCPEFQDTFTAKTTWLMIESFIFTKRPACPCLSLPIPNTKTLGLFVNSLVSSSVIMVVIAIYCIVIIYLPSLNEMRSLKVLHCSTEPGRSNSHLLRLQFMGCRSSRVLQLWSTSQGSSISHFSHFMSAPRSRIRP